MGIGNVYKCKKVYTFFLHLYTFFIFIGGYTGCPKSSGTVESLVGQEFSLKTLNEENLRF